MNFGLINSRIIRKLVDYGIEKECRGCGSGSEKPSWQEIKLKFYFFVRTILDLYYIIIYCIIWNSTYVYYDVYNIISFLNIIWYLFCCAVDSVVQERNKCATRVQKMKKSHCTHKNEKQRKALWRCTVWLDSGEKQCKYRHARCSSCRSWGMLHKYN